MKTAALTIALWAIGTSTAMAQAAPASDHPVSVFVDQRVLGIDDRTAAQQSLGLYTTLGVEMKVHPWIALGLGLNYENFRTQTSIPGVRTVSNGFGASPSAVFQLTPNVFAKLYGALTHLDYSTVLAPGVSGGFEAWRWIAGGSLSGVWHDGPWRFQPSASVFYGTETQNGFTASNGSAVSGQSIPFGRVLAGPEIGYAFKAADGSWALEPFVFAHGNYDFVATNSALFFGSVVTSVPHGQWSAAAGVGASLEVRSGFFARLQASHESLGMNGFDVWLGQLRGGWKF